MFLIVNIRYVYVIRRPADRPGAGRGERRGRRARGAGAGASAVRGPTAAGRRASDGVVVSRSPVSQRAGHESRRARAGACASTRVARVSRAPLVALHRTRRSRTAPPHARVPWTVTRGTRRSSTGHALRGSIAASRGFLHTRRVTQPHTGAHTTARRYRLHHGDNLINTRS